MNKSYSCNCVDWHENIQELYRAWTFIKVHGQENYQGKPIEYCPWCGKKLIQQDWDK